MRWYRNALHHLLNREIQWTSDQLVFTLHSAAYVPNLDTNVFVSDLTNELPTGGGYTAGGVVATGVTRTYFAAASWPLGRFNTTAQLVDDIVVVGGVLYRCSVAGTTAGAPPAFSTVLGTTTVDGTVTWECVGGGIELLGTNAVAWANATFTGARYLVLSDRTPVGATNQPLLGIEDFGSPQSGAGGTFTVQWPNNTGATLTGLYATIG